MTGANDGLSATGLSTDDLGIDNLGRDSAGMVGPGVDGASMIMDNEVDIIVREKQTDTDSEIYYTRARTEPK